MTNPDIARRRMANQLLTGSSTASPVDVVRRLGAMQSQDYLGAKWAVALRCAAAGVTEAEVQRALDDGRILRTHVLRPTWHFVTAEDAAWMLALTGPRVIRAMASRHRTLALDEVDFNRAYQIFREVLAGGQHLTRAELEAALNAGGIATDLPQRFAHIVAQAELAGVLISGAWNGKHNTYALLDLRTASARGLEGAGLGELSRRYFSSHGPATLKDFAWWAGLTVAQSRMGLELARDGLRHMEAGGKTYYAPPDQAGGDFQSPLCHLLPAYDEYVVAYIDRTAIYDPRNLGRLHMRGGVLNNLILMDGMVAGGWSREIKRAGVRVTASLLEPLGKREMTALEEAVHRYGAYLGLEASLMVA